MWKRQVDDRPACSDDVKLRIGRVANWSWMLTPVAAAVCRCRMLHADCRWSDSAVITVSRYRQRCAHSTENLSRRQAAILLVDPQHGEPVWHHPGMCAIAEKADRTYSIFSYSGVDGYCRGGNFCGFLCLMY